MHLTADERKALLAPDYRPVRRVADLPESCLAAFASAAGESGQILADPGQEFQDTDAIAEHHPLPWRRLILAGTTNDRCFVHYEHGGFIFSYNLAVFDTNSKRVLWHAYVKAAHPQLDDLRKEILTAQDDDHRL